MNEVFCVVGASVLIRRVEEDECNILSVDVRLHDHAVAGRCRQTSLLQLDVPIFVFNQTVRGAADDFTLADTEGSFRRSREFTDECIFARAVMR